MLLTPLRFATVSLMILLTFGIGPIHAVLTDVVEHEVPITQDFIALDKGILGLDGSTYTALTVIFSPLYGTLVEEPTRYLFYPSDNFWGIGTDRLVYTLHPAPGQGAPLTRMTRLTRGLHGGTIDLRYDFEASAPVPEEVHDPGGFLSRTQEAAMAGDWGMQIDALPSGTTSFLRSARQTIPPNGEDVGSQLRFGTRPPNDRGDPNLEFDFVVLKAFLPDDDDQSQLFRVRLRQQGGERSAIAQLYDVTTGWSGGPQIALPISEDAQRFTIDWWPGLGTDGGFAFWVGDTLAGRLAFDWAVGTIHHVQYELGIVEELLGQGQTSLQFDDLEVYSGSTMPSHAAHLAETFESGTWGGGSVGEVFVSQNAALSGQWGLDRLILDQARGYLTTVEPTQQNRYGVRFTFDPGVATVDECVILGLAEDDDFGGGSEHAKVWLRSDGAGGHELQIWARKNRGTVNSWLQSAWIPIPSKPMIFEVDWRAATGPNLADGHLRLDIDSKPALEITEVPNDLRRVEALRLGAFSVDVAASVGNLYFDDVESWQPVQPFVP